PDTGGFQEQVSPEAVGWQAHLEDDNSAREIYVDRELANWVQASTERRIQLVKEGFGTDTGPVMAPAPDGTVQAVETGFSGAWAEGQRPIAEAWYQGTGIPIGHLYAAWEKSPAITVPENWVW